MPGPGPGTENKVVNKPQASSVYCSHKITPDRVSLPAPLFLPHLSAIFDAVAHTMALI